MKTGVVITTAIRPDWARKCLESVLEHCPKPRVVILMDNNSRDQNREDIEALAREYQDQVVYMRFNDEKGGMTRAWNTGMWYCYNQACDVIMQHNDDTEVDSTYKYFCEAVSRTAGALLMVGPKSNKPGVDYTGHQKLLDRSKLKEGNRVVIYPDAKEGCVNGFCWGVTRDTMEAMHKRWGMFLDEKRYPWGGQEEDFGRRLRAMGGKAAVAEGAYVYHEKFSDWRRLGKK